MSVKVYFHGYIATSSNTLNMVEVNGDTIGQCLNNYVNLYPEIKELIFTENSKVRDTFWIMVNVGGVTQNGLDQPVRNGDELHIMQKICGG